MPRLRRLASRIDDRIDALGMHVRRLRGRAGPATVEPHRGYGTPTLLRVSGHVVDGSAGEPAPEPRNGLWADLRATVRRYVESRVMGARLTVGLGEARIAAVSDSDGFFATELAVEPDDRGDAAVVWRALTVTLEQVPGSRQASHDVVAEVMVVPEGTRFAVVSDIDDTVMKTGIGDLRRNWRRVIRSDPRRRETFPGLPELYRALAFDAAGVQRQPIFYVSSASWGFYPLFARFLELQQIPAGPLLLKNYGLDREQWFAGSHAVHKTRSIERLFETYPDLRFILVGDSGQHDARIYRDLVAQYGDRVLAVWIRDVSRRAERRAEIQSLVEELRRSGVPATFGPHLLTAAEQAAEAGWIAAADVAGVRAAVERSGAARRDDGP